MSYNTNVADLGTIVERSLNEIYIFDLDTLKFQYVNQSGRKNLGYSTEELLELTPLDLKPQFSNEHFRQLIAPLRDNVDTPIVFKTTHTRKNQSTYPVEVHLQPSRYAERTVACAIILDITERETSERKRIEAETQRQKAQNYQNIGILAGGLAHDFNNVLASMMGYADLALLQAAPTTELHAFLQEMATGIDDLTLLTRQLQYFSGKGRRNIQLVNLRQLIEQFLLTLPGSIQDKCAIEAIFSSDSLAVEIDPDQFRQVLMNLVTNAAEATGDGKGCIRITAVSKYCDTDYLNQSIATENLPPGQFLLVTVTDNGTGMEPELHSRIFDPFFTTKPAQSGLGLSAALGIILGHSGSFTVHSELGKGSTFTIMLPLPGDKAETRSEVDC